MVRMEYYYLVSILVLIEFIFNTLYEKYNNCTSIDVSILVLIEFIFNIERAIRKREDFLGLNPCFDRIYFQ